MNFRENKRGRRQITLLLPAVLLCLLLGGCARKHWSETLEEEESAEIAAIVSSMQEETRSCPNSLDADVLIFWESPLAKNGVAGYLQILSPSFIKFVLSNPLGQPVYAFSTNGKTFQSLETLQRKHIRGNIRSIAIRKEIPPILLSGDWFAYLTGRLPERLVKVQEVNRDVSDQTVWLHLPPLGSSFATEKAYMHLDPEKRAVLGYLFLDQQGRTLVEITYKGQRNGTDLCTPRENIDVTGLSWGTELRIELQEIRTDTQFQEEDFSLPVPPGYETQLRP